MTWHLAPVRGLAVRRHERLTIIRLEVSPGMRVESGK